ncbi:MAG: rhamnogalacturonan acetylesterase [Undibacterium sp.]|nr:rhamnogalacturonan acetylesterase [Undibacterium sp.]
MKCRFLAVGLLVNLLCIQTAYAVQPAADLVSAAPIRIILVGDSTMSPRSGYGDALCQRFQANVSCINLARGGRSSGSFRAEGLWANVQNLLRAGGHYSATYVLIQFGHNDQPGKPGRSTDLVTEFPVNMAAYVKEVRELGGTPVLVTPLTRRTFQAGVLENNLGGWADASRKVAAEQKVALLDLNADSYAAVQAMGQAEADTLAMAPPPENVITPAATDTNTVERAGAAKTDFDRTHLGLKGAAFFAAMVEAELKRIVAPTGPHFKADK